MSHSSLRMEAQRVLGTFEPSGCRAAVLRARRMSLRMSVQKEKPPAMPTWSFEAAQGEGRPERAG